MKDKGKLRSYHRRRVRSAMWDTGSDPEIEKEHQQKNWQHSNKVYRLIVLKLGAGYLGNFCIIFVTFSFF